MKNKYIFLTIVIIGVFLYIYPKIEFYSNGYLYMMSYGKDFEYSKDFSELEEDMCYSESYSYNKKRDITITHWEYKNILFFKWFKISYEKGNLCEKEYLLEEAYINHFIDEAEIIENEDNINLSDLIKDRKAIVMNKRYSWNENSSYIGYKLDDKYMDMYVYFNKDNLLIIQVGLSDEGSKYIAYR